MQHKCARKPYWSSEIGPTESDKYGLRDYVVESRFAENYNGVYSIETFNHF